MQNGEQDAYDAGCRYIQDQMARGVPEESIYQAMVSQGWDAAAVRTLINGLSEPIGVTQPAMPVVQQRHVPQYYSPAQERPTRYSGGGGGGGGSGNMVIGAIICLVGIVITVGSFMAAGNGGTYVVAWGAIVFGAIRFFKGLAGSD